MSRRDSSDTEAKIRPQLRDRLREVLERDRAQAGAEAGDSQPGWPEPEGSDHGFGAPESGTRRRPAQAYESDGLHVTTRGNVARGEVPERDILDDLLEQQEQYDREQERARLEALAFEAARGEHEHGFHESLDPQEALALRASLLGLPTDPLASHEGLGEGVDLATERDALALDAEVLDAHVRDAHLLDTPARDTLARDTLARDTLALDTLALDTLERDTLERDTDDAGEGHTSAALFADWIAEEIAELEEWSSAPLALSVAEPALPSLVAVGEPEDATSVDVRAQTPAAIESAVGDASASGREPIQTRTMARLLAGHGYRARALSIYDELLRRNPHQPELRAEAEALRRSP